MSFYSKMAKVGTKFVPKHKLFKYGFNWSPMYKRSTAKIVAIEPDLSYIKIKLPISYKNRNYANSIFGGSMFAAVDPIPMVQLINILGDNYVVWDKAAQIRFKRPAKQHLYADFRVNKAEIQQIQADVAANNEIEISKTTYLTNEDGTTIFCEVDKTIYIAKKSFYKEKLARRKQQK
ncbi:PaaI family thioesterase [Flavobacterium sp. ASW18X]|uniref:PaaI family thioesterase n=1 Tax=Flavobacterium sp. ASW18X TaxID=2572595 RepID=UPI0010ADBA33|nr:DUF4442 domain-containing protein [Flavobacterium sp. ASW18X]TKD58970.1 DUF4442 domain-containing protein [Flavobacterium sp. ASW18X]